jgi:hypothetical protein
MPKSRSTNANVTNIATIIAGMPQFTVANRQEGPATEPRSQSALDPQADTGRGHANGLTGFLGNHSHTQHISPTHLPAIITNTAIASHVAVSSNPIINLITIT